MPKILQVPSQSLVRAQSKEPVTSFRLRYSLWSCVTWSLLPLGALYIAPVYSNPFQFLTSTPEVVPSSFFDRTVSRRDATYTSHRPQACRLPTLQYSALAGHYRTSQKRSIVVQLCRVVCSACLDPKVCKLTAFWVMCKGFQPSFYIFSGVQVLRSQLEIQSFLRCMKEKGRSGAATVAES